MSEDRPQLYRRRTVSLTLAILAAIYEDEDEHGVPWSAILETFTTTTTTAKTVENTLYELLAFGAIRRNGERARGRHLDSRRLLPTSLGRAWLEQDTLPPLTREDPNP